MPFTPPCRFLILISGFSFLLACGTTKSPVDTPPSEDDCATTIGQERVLSLNGKWSAVGSMRTPGQPWEAEQDLGDVHVPGWWFPFERFPTRDRDALLTYRRGLEWPETWSCANADSGWHAYVELDSADYHTTLRLGEQELGTHSGYLGRFAIDIPLHLEGELEIELQDQVRDVDSRGSMEDFPHTTLQGADTGGWGINSLGLPGEVRLRLVRYLYLQAAYATTIARSDSRSRLRVGTKVDAVSTPSSAQVEIRVFDAEKALVATHQEAWNPNDEGEQLIEFDVEGLAELGLGVSADSYVEIELVADDTLADSRMVPLIARRLELAEDSLLLNGQRHFARGAGVHHQYRTLPFDGEFTPGTYVALDQSLRGRYQAATEQAAEAGIEWIRPGHLLTDDLFLQTVREHGMLVYQDFPLHWNTDYEVLTPDEIKRQFRSFLWRVAAEPSVTMIALHNEADIGQSSENVKRITQGLVDELLEISAEVAPHLIAIGCSGCRGSAHFPPDSDLPVDDRIADAHAYFGSWWQPTDWYTELPDLVARISQGSTLPVFWSEMGNGWTKHFIYLAALQDDLEPTAPQTAVALRAELESWMRAPDGSPLSLRQWYAGLYCFKELGVGTGGLMTCISEQLQTQTDAAVIAWARQRFLADRPAVEGSPADPIEQGALVAAHWLASQIFESRWQWAEGAGFLGVISWERGENRYPFVPKDRGPVPDRALSRSLEILASANAPIASSMRWLGDDGDLEFRLVNDGEAANLDLHLFVGEDELWTGSVEVAAAAGASRTEQRSSFEAHTGRVLRLEVREGGTTVSTSALLIDP